MAYNENLAERIREVLSEQKKVKEKEMMGGLSFMVNDKMCVGIVKEDLMVRLDPDIYETVLEKNGCREMDFTGRPMKGWVFVDPAGVRTSKELKYWIDLALEYNKKAKSSKKKKKK